MGVTSHPDSRTEWTSADEANSRKAILSAGRGDEADTVIDPWPCLATTVGKQNWDRICGPSEELETSTTFAHAQ